MNISENKHKIMRKFITLLRNRLDEDYAYAKKGNNRQSEYMYISMRRSQRNRDESSSLQIEMLKLHQNWKVSE